jgi:hypothetical protein
LLIETAVLELANQTHVYFVAITTSDELVEVLGQGQKLHSLKIIIIIIIIIINNITKSITMIAGSAFWRYNAKIISRLSTVFLFSFFRKSNPDIGLAFLPSLLFPLVTKKNYMCCVSRLCTM